MTSINKKYPRECSYFTDKIFLSSIGIKKNGKIVQEFYHKCNLNESIMCKRSAKLDPPFLGISRACVIKDRE
ncbi:MAG: hypothetical protein QXE90_04015 [Candidatus Micrarchaeia archaeon]